MAIANTQARKDNILNYVAEIGRCIGREVALYRYSTRRVAYQDALISVNPADIDATMYAASPEGPSYSFYAVSPLGNASKFVTMFYISPFPGCCALCISNGTVVRTEYQNLGVNRIGIKLREAIAIYLGYTGMLCTDIPDSVYSIKTIEGAKFNLLYNGIINRRTNNRINLYLKHFTEE